MSMLADNASPATVSRSDIDRHIDAVIFDFGGVLSSNGRPSDVVRRFPHDPVEKVMKVMMGDYGQDTDHPWHRLERGEITMKQYREGLAPLVLEAGLQAMVEPNKTAITPNPLNRHGIHFDFQPCVPMIDLVHQLKENGFRLGVLTNNVRELRTLWWPMMDFENIFDDVVDSHEVGMRKPNPAIYHLALRRLGVTAQRTAFLDDAQSNVDAASALGIYGVRVDDDPAPAVATIRHLANLSPDP